MAFAYPEKYRSAEGQEVLDEQYPDDNAAAFEFYMDGHPIFLIAVPHGKYMRVDIHDPDQFLTDKSIRGVAALFWQEGDGIDFRKIPGCHFQYSILGPPPIKH